MKDGGRHRGNNTGRSESRPRGGGVSGKEKEKQDRRERRHTLAHEHERVAHVKTVPFSFRAHRHAWSRGVTCKERDARPCPAEVEKTEAHHRGVEQGNVPRPMWCVDGCLRYRE